MPKASSIVGTTFVLAENSLSHELLEERFGSDSMKKVISGAGIRNRRVVRGTECGSDMAFEAAERLINNYGIDRERIDGLIYCTQSPDYILPSTACVLHKRLHLKTGCAAFDINLGCSQYVYALSLANGMISTEAASIVLLLTGDTMTRVVHPKDRSVVPLMGDGGSASLVQAVPENEGFLGFELGTDGSGYEYVIVPAGGFRRPRSAETTVEVTDQEGNTRTAENLYMNGAAIFHFAITVVPKTVHSVLARVGIRIDEVDLFLFHQSSKFMLDYLLKKLSIPAEKTHFYLEEIGNCSGSSLPILLGDALSKGKIKPGFLILLMAFGVGFSWGATLIRWPSTAMFPSMVEA